MAGRGEWDPVCAVVPCPSRDSVVKPALKRSHMKQSERRDSGWGCHMPQEPLKMFQWNRPLALERLQASQHWLSTLLWETCCEVDRVQLPAEKRSSQAPRGRTSGTRGDIDVPAVGQRSGAQGPDSKGRASRSGVWVCGATLTWLHGWAGGAGEGIASSDRTLLPTGEERGGWECGDGGQWRNRTKILHPALLRGKEWCYRHLLKSRIPRLRVARPRDAAYPGTSQAWQGRRRAAPLSCGQLHAAAIVKAAVVAELERRWRQQEGAFGDEQAEGLQPAVGWRQQRTAGAGCDETPPSASVRRRTVGQSPPPLRRIGRPGRSGSPGSGACRTPSYPPRSATGGAPGPLMWTSSDPGPAPWLSSPLARGPSLCSSVQFLQHTWVSITLVQLFQRLGLVDLQEGHGVQGGSGLFSSTVSLGR